MCGLMAVWNASGRVEHELVDGALNKMRHRGPDAQDKLLLESDNLLLSHLRLKIIDISEESNQPFVSPCGRYVLVYNGEIYNFKALKELLGDKWKWSTESDTEVLLAAWSVWGVSCLDHLVGMFSFVIYDSCKKTITAVRDRFGIKPLYYYISDETWVFASEIPPLLCFQDQVKANESVIRTYLETGLYSHDSNTFFADIYAVKPGSIVNIDLVDPFSWSFEQWYDLAENIPDLSSLSKEQISSDVEKLIEQAIHSHLIADVGVGLNVSGGVDSSMLVKITLDELRQAHLFNQDYEGYSELPWVQQIAEGGDLHVAKSFFDDINQWLVDTVRSQAEPFGGVSVCGYNALYQLAVNENITVLLDGNGVDEIFLGYKKYHQLYVHSANSPDERERREDEYRSFWGDVPIAPAKGQSIDGTSGLRPEAITENLRRAPLVDECNVGKFKDPVKEAAAKDLLFAKIPRGLRFNDRVSMYHSRELRVPFLDHRLVEYAFAIPSDMLLTDKGSKSLFRELLAKRAPESVAYAAKRSVQSPQREWLGKEWKSLVESILSSESFFNRGWVDSKKAKDAYKDYLQGNNDNSFFIWQWINLELWAREFLD